MAPDSANPAAASPRKPVPVAGRECGECAMCCHLTAIPVIDKKAGEWCVHCSSHQRCDIYETRPAPCREFFCLYRLNPTLGDAWYPAHAHMMLKVQEAADGSPMVIAMVDPAYPDCWRAEPYLSRFKKWAGPFQVIIAIGLRKIAVFPDHEKDLGEISADTEIEYITVPTPKGMQKTVRLKHPPSAP